jgi:hypothetical protein
MNGNKEDPALDEVENGDNFVGEEVTGDVDVDDTDWEEEDDE